MEIMNRFMAELGLTPSARTRLARDTAVPTEPLIVLKTVYASDEDPEADEVEPGVICLPADVDRL